VVGSVACVSQPLFIWKIIAINQLKQGKSSLLLGLLGEYDVLKGSLNMPNVLIAYASQDIYLQSGLSIRENILFGTAYHVDKYKRAIKACALDQDLSSIQEGDLAKASGLSGGQRAVSVYLFERILF